MLSARLLKWRVWNVQNANTNLCLWLSKENCDSFRQTKSKAKESDFIGKWRTVNIDQSIFNVDCVNKKWSPQFVFLAFVFYAVVQCFHRWEIKMCNVIICTRMPNTLKSIEWMRWKMCDMKRTNSQKLKTKEWRTKPTEIKCTQTTINYLVISLQAANKFNRCVKDWRFKPNVCTAYAYSARIYSDYMCSF